MNTSSRRDDRVYAPYGPPAMSDFGGCHPDDTCSYDGHFAVSIDHLLSFAPWSQRSAVQVVYAHLLFFRLESKPTGMPRRRMNEAVATAELPQHRQLADERGVLEAIQESRGVERFRRREHS
jgi:hypothetical protein